MPPAKKFQREDIIRTAYELVKSEGMGEMNARRIAKELGCSTQPIYHNFDTMEELREKVIERIYEKYVSYMKQGAKEEKPYLGMGMSYILFARDYPNFFEVLFRSESGMSPVEFIQSDDVGSSVLKEGQIFSGITAAQEKEFQIKVWVFTHGLATLAAMNTVKMSEEEIREMLASATRELLVGFKWMRKQEEQGCEM